MNGSTIEKLQHVKYCLNKNVQTMNMRNAHVYEHFCEKSDSLKISIHGNKTTCLID